MYHFRQHSNVSPHQCGGAPQKNSLSSPHSWEAFQDKLHRNPEIGKAHFQLERE